MKQRGRGTLEESEADIEGCKLRAVKWFDNKPVSLASSFSSAYPTKLIQRCDRKTKQDVTVVWPETVSTYNEFMGGVDLLDDLIAYYRIRMRSKKYHLRLFFHFVDVAVINSWLLYRRDCKANSYNKNKIMNLITFKSDS
ncbi:hypothetical protein ILUMI_07029 [Ignelater luminosus]|uniref:PiggyBac transposable element-derived protein domain-containing protein n=1 Tax=Ignelater luminosus TaxID=2038154 RepID=A0A8K0GC00_IGNLU|nr:hypothetical protein ILUMI_07029 [Ignelater luminosus]